ncbi:MAG: porin family protein [Hyphomicrobiales bacterium]|nr:porin family protein [Hyphomicrobiales bacterium]
MKVLTSLACAAAIVAAPASAADLLGTAAPFTLPAPSSPLIFESGSNWYVRGDLGISFDDAPSVSFSSISVPPPGFPGAPLPVYSGQNIHSTDFTGGVGAGYRFNNYLRFDATWDYRTGPGGSSSATVVCPYGLTGLTSQAPPNPLLGYLYNTTNTCIGSANIKQHNNTFLANAYVDLGTYYGFTPYVGGGAGFNINTMSGSLNFNETANGLPYAANLTPTGAYPQLWLDQFGTLISPQPNIAFTQQNWNRTFSSTTYSFAWALAAGLGFQLTPSATLDVGYRYLNSGAITTLINPQTGMTVKQNNWSQQIRVGLRYTLQ